MPPPLLTDCQKLLSRRQVYSEAALYSLLVTLCRPAPFGSPFAPRRTRYDSPDSPGSFVVRSASPLGRARRRRRSVRSRAAEDLVPRPRRDACRTVAVARRGAAERRRAGARPAERAERKRHVERDAAVRGELEGGRRPQDRGTGGTRGSRPRRSPGLRGVSPGPPVPHDRVGTRADRRPRAQPAMARDRPLGARGAVLRHGPRGRHRPDRPASVCACRLGRRSHPAAAPALAGHVGEGALGPARDPERQGTLRLPAPAPHRGEQPAPARARHPRLLRVVRVGRHPLPADRADLRLARGQLAAARRADRALAGATRGSAT